MTKKILALLLALVLCLGLMACAASTTTEPAKTEEKTEAAASTTTEAAAETTEASGDPINVGFIAPLSGANAAVGTSNQTGVEMAVEEINAAGGINGRPLKLFAYDDENDASVAVSMCNKLIYNDNVCAIIGSTNSSVTLGAMTITQDAGIPELTPNSSGAAITNSGYKYIIRVQLNDLKMAEACVKYAVENCGYKKIALMYQDDDYGTGGMEVITDVMKGYNMELVACEAFDAASTDMSAQLVNVKAADPDCLIMWCMYTPGATIATQARQLGIEAQFMGGGGLTNAKLYELGGENVVGLINTQPFLAGADAINDFSKAFIENYTAKYGKAPDSNVGMAYDYVYTLKEGIQYALDTYNDLEGDHLMEGMLAIKDVPMATGNMTCSPNGDLDREQMLLVRLNEDGSYSVVN